MIIKFVWYTGLVTILVAFCMLNQHIQVLDLYWVKILAPAHFWYLTFFSLGVFMESIRSFTAYLWIRLFSEKK